VNNYTNGIVKAFEVGAAEIAAATLKNGRRYAAAQAGNQSRKGAMQAQAELCNRTMEKFLAYLYESDEVGFCNIDGLTGEMLRGVAVPWSSTNYQRFGIHRTMADALKAHVDALTDFHETHPATAPLFTYDMRKKWALNIFDFPDLASALRYWRKVQFDAKTYAHIYQAIRTSRAEAQQKRSRGKS